MYNAHFDYAYMLENNLKDEINAIVHYEKASKIKPDIIEPYINLSRLYYFGNNINEARRCCEKGLEINSNDSTLIKWSSLSTQFWGH